MIKNRRIASQGKYTLNEHYFDIIDTERKAYFLGFLFADGCNSKYKAQIQLSECDKELLIKLSKEIESNAPILMSPPRVIKFKKDIKSYLQKPSCIFRLNSIYLCKKLSELGCVSRKTFSLTFPDKSKLPVKFQKDFLRGYFDGDGSLSILKNRPGTNFTFIGRKKFCLKVKRILESTLHLKLTFRKFKTHNFWTLQTGSIPKIKKILDFLYNNATIYLNRKHKKYIDFIKLKYEPYIKYSYKWNRGNRYSKPQY
jgi:hypothetical protein